VATATAESSSLSAFSLANLSAAAFFSSSVSSSATSPPAGLSSALSASSAGLSASSSGFAGSGIAAPVLRSLPLESLSSASFYSAVLPVEAALALKKSTVCLRDRFREVFGTPDSFFITSSGGLLGYKASCTPKLIFCNLVIFSCFTGHEFSEEVNL